MPNDMHPGCDWVRDRVDLYVDRAPESLDDGERALVARHAAGCAACARDIEMAARIRNELRSLPAPALAADVIARAEREIAGVVPIGPRRSPRRWAVAVAAAAVAGVATVALLRPAGDTIDTAATAPDAQAVEMAARDAALALAYVGKYTRRTGHIVEHEVEESMRRALERSGMIETKPPVDRS